MTELVLPCGKVTVVDDCDDHLLRAYPWRSRVDQKSGTVYVSAQVRRDGKRSRVHLHRLVAGSLPGEHTDRRDGDGLNNRRGNLRRCAPFQNGRNRQLTRRHMASPYKGVSLIEKTGRWRAGIKVDYRRHHLGCFASEIEAARAYDAAALKHFGEFARLNFPEHGDAG